MKKTILILAAFSLVFAASNAKTKKEKKSKKSKIEAPVKIFTNDVDSMSYALGMNVGADFAKNIKGIPGGKSNIDLLVKGFSAVMKGDSTLMSQEVASEFFKNYITEAQTKEVEAKRGDGEKFLTANKSKEGVNVTASGLQYEVLVPADGPKPTAVDSVKVHYQGFLLDGTKFDSSVDRGEPIVFPLNQVIPGWTEGVQLMSVGSKYKFYVPYQLGYGEQGAGGVIPPFATLTFEIELLDIMPLVEQMSVIDISKDSKAVAPAAKKVSKK